MPGIEHAEEVQHGAQQIRRPHDGDFGIAADDDGVGVVAAWLQRQVTGLRMIMKQAI
jgi:hypothetical protein